MKTEKEVAISSQIKGDSKSMNYDHRAVLVRSLKIRCNVKEAQNQHRRVQIENYTRMFCA